MLRSWTSSFRLVPSRIRLLSLASAEKGLANGAAGNKILTHPRTLLIGVCSKLKWRSPEFQTSASGPSRKPPLFSASVKVFTNDGPDGEVMEFTSNGHGNKSQAVYHASLAACAELKKRGVIAVQLPSVESDGSDPRKPVAQHPSVSKLGQHPKMAVQRFSALFKTVKRDYREPKEDFQLMPDRSWLCKLYVYWPETTTLSAKAVSKSNASHAVYLKLLQRFQNAGYFDDEWRPTFHTSQQLKEFDKGRRVKICLPPLSDEMKTEMDDLFASAKEFESEVLCVLDRKKQALLDTKLDGTADELEEALDNEAVDDAHSVITSPAPTDECQKSRVVDIITNKVLGPTEEVGLMERNQDLYTRMTRRKKRTLAENNINEGAQQAAFPISAVREEILNLLSKNRAVVVAGGTGCGKTTQVPQYIFDDCVQRLKGASCNILVTQPRRISAISVANRVAWERWERIGDTVGYHVRLGYKPPAGRGSILFLTPAMLLRKLGDNQNFEGISHVIVDEVHERDLWTDFLLVILKRALTVNENLKVILMSASMDSKKLSDYFGGCPVVTVEGNNFDVKEYFLDDFLPMTDTPLVGKRERNSTPPVTDHKTVVDTLSYIHRDRSEGAVLCFLPSWDDIVKVRQLFQERHADRSDYAIYACHSRLPLSEQEKIFQPAFSGMRKIVLSTNIAETSITINDVRYVVNTGTRKNSSTDRNLRSIRQEWASKSSQIQRKGRAGRVASGECFHLFTRDTFDEMRPYDIPAIAKEPLESVILFSKLCCPTEDPIVLLEGALDTPTRSLINNAIRLLTDMELLTEERCLTPLGAHVARLGCHPMFGLALIYGSVFKCVEPIVTLTSILQTDGLVRTVSEINDSRSGSQEFEVKQRFMGNSSSDHLAQVNLFTAYRKSVADGTAVEFVEEYSLRSDNLKTTEALRRLFALELSELGICSNLEECLDSSSWINENAANVDLVKAVLAAGFHRQVLWHGKGAIDRGRILRDKPRLMDQSTYRYVTPGGSLFNSRALMERDWTNHLFLFANKMLVNGTKSFRVDGLSNLSPFSLLLYGGQEPTYIGDGVINLVHHYYQISTTDDDARRVLELRMLIRKSVDWKLAMSVRKDDSTSSSLVEHFNVVNSRLASIVTELLAQPSKQFISVSDTQDAVSA